MDFNLVVVAGMLAAPPERLGDSGRVLLTVRSRQPESRVDLIGVKVTDDALLQDLGSGDRLWVSGSLQRQFSAATGRSRVEVVAHQIERQRSPAC